MTTTPKLPRRAPRPGFSLIELTLVVAIMGVLIAVVTYNIVGKSAQAEKKATEASLTTLRNAIDSYRVTHKLYPATLQDLVATKEINAGMKDAWKREFFYSNQGRPGTDQAYLLSSSGPDGAAGTEDDISVWDINK
jgi:general secretion pathway protein G